MVLETTTSKTYKSVKKSNSNI